jgi:hypothetical protein
MFIFLLQFSYGFQCRPKQFDQLNHRKTFLICNGYPLCSIDDQLAIRFENPVFSKKTNKSDTAKLL